MKKVKFFKSLRTGEYLADFGYYYQAKNGIETAITGESGGWCATEITTGLSLPIWIGKTLNETTKEIETIAETVKTWLAKNKNNNIINHHIQKIQELRTTNN